MVENFYEEKKEKGERRKARVCCSQRHLTQSVGPGDIPDIRIKDITSWQGEGNAHRVVSGSKVYLDGGARS